jgi:hypothetical protein
MISGEKEIDVRDGTGWDGMGWVDDQIGKLFRLTR